MGAPVPQIMKDFEDNVRHVPQELVQKWRWSRSWVRQCPRSGNLSWMIFVPQFLEAAVEVVRDTPLERVLHRTPGAGRGCATAPDHGQNLGFRSTCAS